MNKAGLIFGGLFLLVGIFFLRTATVQFMADGALAAKGEVAEGTVIGSEKRRGRRARRAYAPVISFRDNAGIQRQFSGQASKRRPEYDVGDKVTVIYDPANPASATIDSFTERHLGSLIFGFFGAAFTLLGGIVLLGRVPIVKRDRVGRRTRRR